MDYYSNYQWKMPEPEPIKLQCRACGELKVPWMSWTLGCPPEYCPDCEMELGKYRTTGWGRK